MTEVCVAGDGSVASSRTLYSSGDPWLDESYRETLARWRFKPTSSQRCRKLRFDVALMTPDGGPACVETELKFVIRIN